MSRPTEEELAIALEKAAQMRESGDDDSFLAKSLLNLNYRNEILEEVLSKAKHYMHSGQASREHTLLLKAIEKADKADAYLGEEPPGPLG